MLYNELKNNEEIVLNFVRLGVLSPFWLTYIEIFEDFITHPELCKECRYEKLSEKYGYKSSSSIKKIVKRLSC